MSRQKGNHAEKLVHSRVVQKSAFKPGSYEISDTFTPGSPSDPKSVHTMNELHECLRSNEGVALDGLVLTTDFNGEWKPKRINRKDFLEAWKINTNRKFRESFDSFARDIDGGSSQVGHDFIPLLGGPFNKQLYFHDALKMYALCFYAYNHDPIAHALINILCNFVLGRGFRVDAKHEDPKVQQSAQAIWEAFSKANDIPSLAIHLVKDSSRDGELLLWKLPNNQTKVGYELKPGQEAPKGELPRYRLIDPSTCWEIVTYPEDISRVLFYQLVFPTQYQMYTGKDGGSYVPSSKFIIQQVPAAEVRHYKLNCAYNEKRGRSDLFPILGYLKRLRDSVDYSLIAMQKSAAYSIDTTIEGSQTDVDAYVSAQEELGTIPPAGSDFVHTKKITRQYLSNHAAQGGSANPAFNWALNMACAGFGIPVSYLGTDSSGSHSRASALVGTEPVAKFFQARQMFVKKIIVDMFDDLMKHFGFENVECQVTFPEIISQDRSAKIQDIILAKDESVFSQERAAEMIAKELDQEDYDFSVEQEKIAAQAVKPYGPTIISPLTAPPAAPAQNPAASNNDNPGSSDATAVTQDARRKLSMNHGA